MFRYALRSETSKPKKTRLGGFFCEGKLVAPAFNCELQLLAFHEVVHAAFSQAEPLIGFTAIVGIICVDFFPLWVGVVQV